MAALSPIGLGSLTETLTRMARWPVLLIVLLIGLAVLYRNGPIGARRAGSGSPSAAYSRQLPGLSRRSYFPGTSLASPTTTPLTVRSVRWLA